MKNSCATQCFKKRFSTYLDCFFSWFLNLEFWILFLIILDSWKTWNLKLLLNLSLDSWIVLDSILKSFSWAFCHHLCYHQTTLNQSWFIIMNQSWFIIMKQWSFLLQPLDGSLLVELLCVGSSGLGIIKKGGLN